MDLTRVLVTACGCPGASTLIRMLRREGVQVFGVDMDGSAVGRFMMDGFDVVPPASSPKYVDEMLKICRRRKIDVVLPTSSTEIQNLSENSISFSEVGATVMVSKPQAVQIANNKFQMYEYLRGTVGLPEYRLIHSLGQFVDAAHALGYPDRDFVFKPPVSKGSRGFRIVSDKVNRRGLLLETKPNSRYISYDEVISIFRDSSMFPQLLLMEYLDGVEYTVDALCKDGEMLLGMVKTVEEARWGVIVRGETVERPELLEQAEKIVRKFGFDYHVNLQFIGDQLIEINPRISTFMYQPDLCPPLLGVRLAAGDIKAEDVKRYRSRIRFGWHMVRYMDQVFCSEDGDDVFW